MTTPRILVIGAGALGGFYAAKLSQAGADVSVVCRSDADFVAKQGFAIKSFQGDFTFIPKQVLRNSADYQGKADYVLLTTKVLPGIDPVALLRPVVHDNTVIVLIQNGIFIEAPIKAAFPHNQLISCLAFLGSNRTGPGQIHHISNGHLKIGVYPSGTSPEADALAELFTSVDIGCKVSDPIQKSRWRKIAWNAPFNPLSVVSGGLDTLTLIERCEPLLRDLMAEILVLAKADGHPLSESLPQELLDYTKPMGHYKTSMLCDYEANRAMEIDAILGSVCEFADNKGISVPKLNTLYHLLLAYQPSA